MKENKSLENVVNYITFDDFLKVKLATGKIINSEKVEGADKLLKNTVDIYFFIHFYHLHIHVSILGIANYMFLFQNPLSLQSIVQ